MECCCSCGELFACCAGLFEIFRNLRGRSRDRRSSEDNEANRPQIIFSPTIINSPRIGNNIVDGTKQDEDDEEKSKSVQNCNELQNNEENREREFVKVKNASQKSVPSLKQKYVDDLEPFLKGIPEYSTKSLTVRKFLYDGENGYICEKDFDELGKWRLFVDRRQDELIVLVQMIAGYPGIYQYKISLLNKDIAKIMRREFEDYFNILTCVSDRNILKNSIFKAQDYLDPKNNNFEFELSIRPPSFKLQNQYFNHGQVVLNGKCELTINNFKEKKLNNEIVSSKHFYDEEGWCWRLTVYPNGNVDCKFLTVYLELLNVNSIKHRASSLELISSKPKVKNIVKESEDLEWSQLQKCNCFVWENFVEYSKIAADGFLKDGSLIFKCSVWKQEMIEKVDEVFIDRLILELNPRLLKLEDFLEVQASKFTFEIKDPNRNLHFDLNFTISKCEKYLCLAITFIDGDPQIYSTSFQLLHLDAAETLYCRFILKFETLGAEIKINLWEMDKIRNGGFYENDSLTMRFANLVFKNIMSIKDADYSI